MNILVLGNGFDLAHELPTRYSDFLTFLKRIDRTKAFASNVNAFSDQLTDININDTVKQYLINAFDSRMGYPNEVTNANKTIQEIYDCLDNNIWYKYFIQISRKNSIKGINWIDFESEIREVIEYFDNKFTNNYSTIPLGFQPDDCSDNVKQFCKGLDCTFPNQSVHKLQSDNNTVYDFVDKTFSDLSRLIRCLEIYLSDCIGKIPITKISPDIENLDIDYILNFNYTPTYFEVYKKSFPLCHYIHGQAKANNTIDENNMVLGVNEYWSDTDRDTRTNFNVYKKFVQRLLKQTGNNYKHWLAKITEETIHPKAATKQQKHYVFIFGHSLDITDKDILREIILTPKTDTTIFYKDKQQHASQIANLSKILGQDTLIDKTFSYTPSIAFIKQQEMEDRT